MICSFAKHHNSLRCWQSIPCWPPLFSQCRRCDGTLRNNKYFILCPCLCMCSILKQDKYANEACKNIYIGSIKQLMWPQFTLCLRTFLWTWKINDYMVAVSLLFDLLWHTPRNQPEIVPQSKEMFWSQVWWTNHCKNTLESFCPAQTSLFPTSKKKLFFEYWAFVI